MYSPTLRKDESGEAGGWIGGLIMLVVAIFIFLSLITSIAYQVTQAQANTSVDATADIMLGLITLLLIVAAVLVVVGFAVRGMKGGV